MKLSVLDYADDVDADFREQIRGLGPNLHERFYEVVHQIMNKKTITQEAFAKSLGYSSHQIRIWERGKAAIPLTVLENVWKLGNRNLQELEDNIKYLKVYRSSRLKIPKELTTTIAEIAGRHCGDGSCTISSNKDYRVTLTETTSLIQKHNKQIKNLFGVKPSVEKISETISKSIVNSKVYCRFFTNILGIPSGEKTWIVKEPKIIKNAGLEFRKHFVGGLVDTEGCLYFGKNRSWVLEIHMVNINLMSTIADVLEKFNLKTKIETKKNSYSLRLIGKDKIKKYFVTFGTSNGKYKIGF